MGGPVLGPPRCCGFLFGRLFSGSGFRGGVAFPALSLPERAQTRPGLCWVRRGLVSFPSLGSPPFRDRVGGFLRLVPSVESSAFSGPVLAFGQVGLSRVASARGSLRVGRGLPWVRLVLVGFASPRAPLLHGFLQSVPSVELEAGSAWVVVFPEGLASPALSQTRPGWLVFPAPGSGFGVGVGWVAASPL